MATRRQNIDQRCPRCLINKALCFCHLIPTIDTQTKVSLVVHIKEKVLSSNTAHLTHQCLTNSEFFYRGLKDQPFDSTFKLDPAYSPLYLYPTEEAYELTAEFLQQFDKPIQLVVPDGSWRQAKKFHKRVPLFKNIPHVKLPTIPDSIYELRKQKFKNSVCTLEAIAYALGIIENMEVKDKLFEILKIKNERVKESRALSYEHL